MISACSGCGSERLDSVLHLGSSPPPCSMLRINGRMCEQTHYPLELLRCADCSLVQLSCIVAPSEVFHAAYPYSSGNSGVLREHFARLAASVPVEPHDLAVDIGANDGTLLANFKCRRLAVEPTCQIHRARAKGVQHCLQDFFGSRVAQSARREFGPARVITACNVLAHVPDIHDVMAGIAHLLADDGLVVCENHDVASIVDHGQWDTIYHEHLRYYSPYSFARIAAEHGLYPLQVRGVSVHGGSFRMILAKRYRKLPADRTYDFVRLRERVTFVRRRLRELVAGKDMAAIGATARATTVVNHCGLDVEDLAAAYEVPGSDKIGHYLPGTRIPVIAQPADPRDLAPYLLNLLWYMPRVAPAMVSQGYNGVVVTPLPAPTCAS